MGVMFDDRLERAAPSGQSRGRLAGTAACGEVSRRAAHLPRRWDAAWHHTKTDIWRLRDGVGIPRLARGALWIGKAEWLPSRSR
jgi:hypothetical protein